MNTIHCFDLFSVRMGSRWWFHMGLALNAAGLGPVAEWGEVGFDLSFYVGPLYLTLSTEEPKEDA